MAEPTFSVLGACAAWKHPTCSKHQKRRIDNLTGLFTSTGTSGSQKRDQSFTQLIPICPMRSFYFNPLMAVSMLYRETRALLFVCVRWVSEVWGVQNPVIVLLSESCCWSASKSKRDFSREQLYCRLRKTYNYCWRYGTLTKKDAKEMNTG